jgi:hypothetical protein
MGVNVMNDAPNTMKGVANAISPGLLEIGDLSCGFSTHLISERPVERERGDENSHSDERDAPVEQEGNDRTNARENTVEP